MIEIIETVGASRQLDRLLDAAARWRLDCALVENPTAGVLIRGGRGLRKLRWAPSGQGKSGGVRIIYYLEHSEYVFIVDAYAKAEKPNLTRAELHVIVRTLSDPHG